MHPRLQPCAPPGCDPLHPRLQPCPSCEPVHSRLHPCLRLWFPGEQLKAARGVSVTLSQPEDVLPLLEPGYPTSGAANANAVEYYTLYTGFEPAEVSTTVPASSPLSSLYLEAPLSQVSITVSAKFGNPDLFVSNSQQLPTATAYTWRSQQRGPRRASRHACPRTPQAAALRTPGCNPAHPQAATMQPCASQVRQPGLRHTGPPRGRPRAARQLALHRRRLRQRCRGRLHAGPPR